MPSPVPCRISGQTGTPTPTCPQKSGSASPMPRARGVDTARGQRSVVTMGGETESPWELSRLRKPGKVPLQWMRSRASNWALGQVLTHWGVCPPGPGCSPQASASCWFPQSADWPSCGPVGAWEPSAEDRARPRGTAEYWSGAISRCAPPRPPPRSPRPRLLAQTRLDSLLGPGHWLWGWSPGRTPPLGTGCPRAPGSVLS